MNRDIGWLAAPLAAIVLFAFVVWQTMGALSASGAWARESKAPVVAPNDPFSALDALAASAGQEPALAARDPFGHATAPAPAPGPGVTTPKRPVAPPAPARPVLTAVIWDADPRALVRWNGRDYTVKSGGLFDEFQVISISRDQVVLKRGDENIVLQRKPQGD